MSSKKHPDIMCLVSTCRLIIYLLFFPTIKMSCLSLVSAVHGLADSGPNPPLVPAILVFGDSTVDAGNNDFLETVVKSNFPPYGRDFESEKPTGRFCNGRLVTDYIASFVGLPYAPAYLNPQSQGHKIVQGTCFASSASGYYDGTAQNFNVVSLTGQLKWYQQYLDKLAQTIGPQNASDIISKALFILSTGSNDFVNNYYINLPLRKRFNLDQYQRILLSSYSNFMNKLYQSGARRVAVVSLPPLGCLPSQITLYGKGQIKCVDFQNRLALSFNQKFLAATLALRQSLPGLRLSYFDVYTILQEVIRDPTKYGFTYALRGCCGVGRLAVSILCNELTPDTCSNASSYVFWDSFHPSDSMNYLIAKTLFPQGVKDLLH